ncbi:MAG TPA: hypothetical protein VMT67_04065 [Terriglobales bacterium]|nr:hypothetical protein [Terriglobales bacterium]
MTNTMPIKAKVMIGMVAVASLSFLTFGVTNWHMPAWPQLALLMFAAVLTSRLKVKLPGMTSTMSGNLPVILLGVTQLGLLGSLLVAVTAAVAQSFASATKMKPVQFVFNICTLMNACALAYAVYHSHYLLAHGGAAVTMTAAAAAYFLANTAPVAGIIGLTEAHNPFAIWHKVFLWSFPNYVIGAGLTALASLFGSTAAVATLGTMMVVLFGVYKSYKTYVANSGQDAPKVMAVAAGH